MSRGELTRTTRTLADQATDTIRRWIIDGRLQPGDPLVEARIAGEVGVSRVPIREALQRLAEQGFVESRPGHSAIVRRRSARDIVEMFAVRSVIEGLVCRLAAQRRRDEDLEFLDTCVAEGAAASASGDWEAVSRLNAGFHLHLTKVAGNHHLEEMVESYRYRLAWLHGASAELRGEDAWHQHRAILDAVVAGDGNLAEKLGRAHVLETSDAFAAAYMEGRLAI